MPATQSDDRCRQVPRLPRKVTVDVTKCHACHANSGGVHGAKREPSAPPEPAQCHKCHACHEKVVWWQVVCEQVVCVWAGCVWASCVVTSCVVTSCVWARCVWARCVCVSKLCGDKLCVCASCVCAQVVWWQVVWWQVVWWQVVCEQGVCEQVVWWQVVWWRKATGGRGQAGAERRKCTTKNKNPTQRCGEQFFRLYKRKKCFFPQLREARLCKKKQTLKNCFFSTLNLWNSDTPGFEKKSPALKKCVFFPRCSHETQTSPALQKTIVQALKNHFFACLLSNLPTPPRYLV